MKTKIIQNTRKSKYIYEFLKYGKHPSLEELQCLNLLIDILQPKVIQSFLDQLKIEKPYLNLCTISDTEIRNRTVRDSGFMMKEIQNLGIKPPPWSWLKIYLPRYKKRKKELIKENQKRLRMIKNLLYQDKIPF